jgi:hypothetical protein
VVIEHACPFVKTPSVPRVHKAELFEIEMMAKLVAKRAQERAKRGNFFANCRSHPEANQHGIRGVVAEELEGSMLAAS